MFEATESCSPDICPYFEFPHHVHLQQVVVINFVCQLFGLQHLEATGNRSPKCLNRVLKICCPIIKPSPLFLSNMWTVKFEASGHGCPEICLTRVQSMLAHKTSWSPPPGVKHSACNMPRPREIVLPTFPLEMIVQNMLAYALFSVKYLACKILRPQDTVVQSFSLVLYSTYVDPQKYCGYCQPFGLQTFEATGSCGTQSVP